jgi:hypothetical protein
MKQYTIYGITNKGDKFRPSAWAEMLVYDLVPISDTGVVISTRNKTKHIIFCESLKDLFPSKFNHYLIFAKANNLKITIIDKE